MKKTIVAAAVAAVFAAPAMADVSISGQINQEFVDSGSDWKQDLNSDIVIKGSEDLGNGMKASFVIHRYFDDGQYGSLDSSDAQAISKQVTADQSISLSGDFGSVKAGRFEPYTVSAITSMMNIDAADTLDLETSFGVGRSNGGLQYVSPAMNGLTVGIEGFASEDSTGDDFATTTVFGQYSNAGLTVKVAKESFGNGTSASLDVTSIGASYKMGDLEVRVVDTDDDNGTSADVSNTFFGAKYTMGANTIAFGMNDHDTAGNDDRIYSFSHALSKRTSVYLVHETIDATGTDDNTAMGIKHTF